MCKREERKRNIIKRVVAETINLIHTIGYKETTMEEIARKSEITKRTLYSYFHVKEAILGEYIKITFTKKDFYNKDFYVIKNNFQLSVKSLLSLLLDGVLREPEIFSYYINYITGLTLTSNQESVKPSGIQDMIKNIIRVGNDNNDISENITHQFAIDYLLFIFVSLTKEYYKDPIKFNIDNRINTYTKIYLNTMKG